MVSTFQEGERLSNGLPRTGLIRQSTMKNGIRTKAYKDLRKYYIHKKLGWSCNGLRGWIIWLLDLLFFTEKNSFTCIDFFPICQMIFTNLEDHPASPVIKWLVAIASFRPLRIGLFHLQMALLWLIKWGTPPALQLLASPALEVMLRPKSAIFAVPCL